MGSLHYLAAFYNGNLKIETIPMPFRALSCTYLESQIRLSAQDSSKNRNCYLHSSYVCPYPMKKSAMARLQTRKRGTSILDLEAMSTMTTQPFPSSDSRNTIHTEHLQKQRRKNCLHRKQPDVSLGKSPWMRSCPL